MLSHQGGVDKVYPDPRQNPFLKMSLHLSVLEQLSEPASGYFATLSAGDYNSTTCLG